MNIAFSTLLLFFLLLPGIFYRRFYYSEEFSKQYFRETFFGIFISTFIPSLLFQAIWLLFAKSVQYEVDLKMVFHLISATADAATFQNIEQNLIPILGYNLSMLISASILGRLSKNIVRMQKWDRKYKHFRFQNAWHYILKGEFFDFPRANITLEKDTVEDIEFVFVDALVELDDIAIIYDGILVDYELNKTGGLEHISLKNVQRRFIHINSLQPPIDKDETLYPIQGHIMVLKYSELKNVNFSYYTLERDEDVLTPRLVQ